MANNSGIFSKRIDFYDYGKSKKITKARLEELEEKGAVLYGVAEFGYKGKSGLYIERVWNYSEDQWEEYLEWMFDDSDLGER